MKKRTVCFILVALILGLALCMISYQKGVAYAIITAVVYTIGSSICIFIYDKEVVN